MADDTAAGVGGIDDAADPGADPGADDEAPAGAQTDTVAPESPGEPASVEQLIAVLETTTTERDEYLDLARRTQAEFENHRKRVLKQQADDAARSVAALVEQLLPVLDACDGAIHHGASEVEPIYAALLQTLEKEGLERIDPEGDEFDPTRHEAVMHEPAEDGADATVVSDVMRPGYAWKRVVIRPAMVKVRG